MKEFIEKYITESICVKNKILSDDQIIANLEKAVELVVCAYKKNKKVLIAGNGGSAADSQHIAAELVSKFMKERPALNAIALTTNTSVLTAVGNDYSHDYIFTRQVQAYGNSEDVYIAISTSGNSKNIIESIKEAKANGLTVIGMTGSNLSDMDKLCDVVIKVPSNKTSIIQESHIMIGHIICAIVEEAIFGEVK